MAITRRKRKSGTRYQVKVKGSDGKWITETFTRLSDAKKREAELNSRKLSGRPTLNVARQMTLQEYFTLWCRETSGGKTSEGWRQSQVQMFNAYIAPCVGSTRLAAITTASISKVLQFTKGLGRSSQLQRHVYNLLHKMFEDGVEHFEILGRNPVKKSLKPDVTHAESQYFTLEQTTKLLAHVERKPFGVAIWLQLLAGLRAGEVQALRWDCIDFENNRIIVKSTFGRKEGIFRKHTKNKKKHQVAMPPELRYLLERQPRLSEFVVSKNGKFMDYASYLYALKDYCRECGIPELATHALRHSSTIVYRKFGAVRDDLKALLGHSTSNEITDRYDHAKGEKLGEIAKVIRLFPVDVSPKFPQNENRATGTSNESL